jgi:hypothetical protein
MGFEHKKAHGYCRGEFREDFFSALVVRSVLVTPAQLVQEFAEPGRQVGTLGPQVLLQPFSHRIADRPAGLVVHLLDVIGIEAKHDGFRRVFRILLISLKRRMPNSAGQDWFPSNLWVHGLWVKFA